MKRRQNGGLMRDMGIILLSVLLAIMLVKTRILTDVLTLTKDIGFLSSFIAGFFFTSIFTTAPAVVALSEIAQHNPLWETAFLGALGAMCGDLIIFRFVRDRVSRHLFEMVQLQGIHRRFKFIFRSRFFHWLTLLVGGFIIASPLPDELGLSLLGFSKVKTSRFLPLSFTFNFLGILGLGLITRNLL